MGAFPALPLGRRPVLSRILVVYRLDPELASRALLPEGLEPRIAHGHAIVAACYTRLGASRLFRRRDAEPAGGSDHLAYRVAVRQENGAEATWIARRETSSWLEARCGAKFSRGEYGRSAFRMLEDAFAVELTVEGEHGEEFYLRGETAPACARSLFACGQALEDFLGEDRPVRPYDVFAPEADELDLAQHFAPEPLSVFEARSAFLSGGALASGAVLDSAWRIVSRRLATSPGRRPAFQLMPEPRSSPSALPTT